MSGGNRKERPATVEQVFHSLQTRLYHIQIGDIKKNKEFIWRKADEENAEYYKSMIRFIAVNFSSFPDSDCLIKVNYCLEKADELKSNLLTVISKVNFSELGLDFPSIVDEKRKMLLNLIGNELEFYSTELKNIKNELEHRLKRSDNGSKDKSIAESLASIKNNEEVFKDKHVKSFGFSEEHRPLLKKIYNFRFSTCSLINQELTAENEFIEILTADNLSEVKGRIYFACETAQVAYVVGKMKNVSKEFKPSNIAASERFYTKNDKLLNGNDLYSSKGKTSLPKEHNKVDSLFKS